MMSDDEPIKLDDIRVKINDSPKHDDKQKSNGFASQFKKIQEAKEKSTERKKK